MRIPPKLLITLFAALAAAMLVGACGGSDDKGKKGSLDDTNPDNLGFHVAADANRFGGPTPLKVQFFSAPFHETGPVRWRWRFDDGTTSEEQNPSHTFAKPGYYQVLMEARDRKGADAWNLIVGAWPADLWEARQKGTTGPVSSRTVKGYQKVQGHRTTARRRAQLAKSRQRAAQTATSSTSGS
jgi:hypothetical protein